MRVAPVTASARSVPALTYDNAEPGVVNTICTWPAIKSVIAGASPRYGTSAILRPALMLNSAPATWPVEPMPPEPILNLAGIGLGIGDEFGDRLYRQQRIDHDKQRCTLDTGNGRDVAREAEVEIVV